MEKLLKLFIPYMLLLSGIISSVSAATPIPNGEEMVADVMVNQYFK